MFNKNDIRIKKTKHDNALLVQDFPKWISIKWIDIWTWSIHDVVIKINESNESLTTKRTEAIRKELIHSQSIENNLTNVIIQTSLTMLRQLHQNTTQKTICARECKMCIPQRDTILKCEHSHFLLPVLVYYDHMGFLYFASKL